MLSNCNQPECNITNLFETIIHNISDVIIIIMDNKGKFIYCNNNAKNYDKILRLEEVDYQIRYLKFPPFDLNGRIIPFNKIPESRILNHEAFKDMICVIQYQSKKFYFNVSGMPVTKKDESFEYGILFLNDISDKVNNQLLLKSQNIKFSNILKNMTDTLLLVDGDYNITFLNSTDKFSKKYFSKSKDKLNVNNLIKSCKFRAGIDGKELSKEELPIFKIFKDGGFHDLIITVENDEKKYLSINGSPININNGKVKEALLVVRDITEQVKQAKAEQKNAINFEKEKIATLKKSMEMKDEFLSKISHEFKTPLNVINSAIQTLALYENELDSNITNLIDKIKINTYRQMRLVNNLLDITKLKSGYVTLNISKVDIIKVIKKVVDLVREYSSKKGIYLIFISGFDNQHICIDVEKFQRILLNLLSNAIKFTPSGKAVYVTISADQDNLLINVKDTGIGIPKEKQDEIFEQFAQVEGLFSRNTEGTGIGLAIVKELCKVMGASISLKSEVGIGSNFLIKYPLKAYENICIQETCKKIKYNDIVISTQVEFSDLSI